jgi:hypothetical protein
MDRVLQTLKESWNAVLLNESLAPGAEQIVSDLSDMPKEDEFNGVGIAEAAIDDAPVKDINPLDIAKSKTDNPNVKAGIKFNRDHPAQQYKRDKTMVNPETGKGYLPAERPQRMIHSSALLKVLTPDGKEINEEQLKALITVRPKVIIQQNSKLAGSGAEANEVFFDLTLPAYQGLFYNEEAQKFQVVRTCPSAGACKAYCYATSGGYVQYEGPWLSSTRTINFLMNDYEGFKAQVLRELKAAQATHAKKGRKVVLRWHDAGDFFSETYLMMAFDVARQTPEIRHYAYTKQVDYIQKHEADKPANFLFNMSKGGTQDKKVDFAKDKHSKVVPYVFFKDLKIEKGVPLSPEDEKVLKDRLIQSYSYDPNKLITYPELVKTPVGQRGEGLQVIVKPGDGDDAAARPDVLGTLLLVH